MGKKVKVKKVVEVFSIMRNAKYSKMSDADKISVWKIFKAIKPIGKEFEEDVEDLQQKFIPYDGFMKDVQRAIAYENTKANGKDVSDMTDDQYKNFIPQFVKYNEAINNAVKEYEDKEVTLDFEPLTADAFDRLRVSNDWTFVQADAVEEFIC